MPNFVYLARNGSKLKVFEIEAQTEADARTHYRTQLQTDALSHAAEWTPQQARQFLPFADVPVLFDPSVGDSTLEACVSKAR